MYLTMVTLHVLAAVTWIGGNVLFFAVAPRLRTHPEVPVALRELGRTFRVLSWTAFAILLTTGAYFLNQGWDYRTLPLSLKLGLVGIVILFKALHDFWIAPAAAQKRGGSQWLSGSGGPTCSWAL